MGVAVAVETASDGIAASRFVPGGNNSAFAQLALNVNNWASAITFVLLVLLLLLFPQGHLPRRWRIPAAILVADAVVLVTALATRPRLHLPRNGPSVANPYYVSGVGDVLQRGVSFLTAVVVISVPVVVLWSIVRYWRSSGIERLQRKWMALPALGGVLVFIVALPTDHGHGPNFGLATLALLIAIDGMAAAVAVAVLRYHLYDIDRVISRTVSYALLTALLAGFYVGLVSLTTRLVHLQSSLGVAASTLAAAALFHPMRRRVQSAVDKRFNRSRYDAAQLIEAFSSDVREAVSVESLNARLTDIVHLAVAPSSLSLWTPRAEPGRTSMQFR
ncbi:MAG TPA: hypothetical protein VFT62_10825 [Mycobacteriales bacterium]|nr:hypothetical protein [Mycobacteriales bacterium]